MDIFGSYLGEKEKKKEDPRIWAEIRKIWEDVTKGSLRIQQAFLITLFEKG